MAKREGPNLERLFRFQYKPLKMQKTMQKNNIWIRMMNDECDSASNRALIFRKTGEQAMPAEATECDQTTTKCKNYGRQVGQRKVRNFLFQIFLKTMRCYCTSEGCNAQATYPQGCKILVGLKIMPLICSYFSQFYFLLFDQGKGFSYYIDLGKWRSEKSRGWNRCARAFHCLESWNILKMASL